MLSTNCFIIHNEREDIMPDLLLVGEVWPSLPIY